MTAKRSSQRKTGKVRVLKANDPKYRQEQKYRVLLYEVLVELAMARRDPYIKARTDGSRALEELTMTTIKTNFIHAAAIGMASLTFVLLTACQGGDGSPSNPPVTPPVTPPAASFQVVSFGDSLSDVGTYAPIAQRVGGGRFTTNPGQVWTQDVANFYGGTLTAAYTGGFAFPVTAHPDGLGYAQGGARVTDPNGVDFKANGLGPTTVPVVTQLHNYLASHGSFNAGQLVLVNGGGSDIRIHADAVTGGSETTAQADQAVTLAAQQLGAIAAQILTAGAKHVVVSNVGNIGASPLGVNSADHGAELTLLTQTFNAALIGALQAIGIQNQVILVDAYTFTNDTIATFQAKGFTVSNTGIACNIQLLSLRSLPIPSSLFCSPDTYTVSNADQTYMFADQDHPTTHFHALFAAFVEQAVAAAPR
ncbi:acylhydrolase [Caballeronia arationis]|nr:SGNH/GDSL hydrolase family protein [Caballeronia arationis]SAL04358.1 acylhydrolase [Caballeronia arationis]